jgi:hypothetical protein
MSSNQVATVNSTSPMKADVKLVTYDEAPQQFGVSPSRDKSQKLRKFCLDHLCVDDPSDEMLKQMFDYFDENKTGSIDKAEFRKVYQVSFDNYGAPMDDRDVDRQFQKLDANKNGTLCFDEFAILMLSRLKM